MGGLAFPLWLIGTAILFYLNRDGSGKTSKALCLPIIWVSIVGSRPMSFWLGGVGEVSVDATLEGNSLDAAIFLMLIVTGLTVLIRRKSAMRAFVSTNKPLIIYFTYCLVSILWSPIPEPSFKRWIKAIGDLLMVLIVVTDPLPKIALRRFFSYVGFLLIPASVFLIRYSTLGRGFDPDGNAMNTGVTTNKNMLGVLVLTIGLATLWHLLALLPAKGQYRRSSRLIAQGILLGFILGLLYQAHSATSVACFLLGSGLIVVCGLPRVQRKPGLLHGIVFSLVIGGGLLMLIGGDALVAGALGRDSNLTGRTDIWKAVIPLAQNPLIGTGFESFWNSAAKTLRSFSQANMFGNLNSAHNGYIEVYLNLGLVGVGLIVMLWISAYKRTARAFHRDPEVAV